MYAAPSEENEQRLPPPRNASPQQQRAFAKSKVNEGVKRIYTDFFMGSVYDELAKEMHEADYLNAKQDIR